LLAFMCASPLALDGKAHTQALWLPK